MKTLVAAFSIFAISSVCASAMTLFAPGLHINPLIGHWQLSKAEANAATPGAAGGCPTEITFTEESTHQVYTGGHAVNTNVGNYNVGKTSVAVVAYGYVIYELTGKDQIVQKSGLANCYYSKH